MNLRSLALATTALVAIATVASPAQAGQYIGKVNLGLGHAWEDWSDGAESSTDIDLNYTTLHGAAAVNVPYNNRVNFQFDIFGDESLDEAYDPGSSTNGSFFGGSGAGVHLNWTDPAVGGIGVFGALARANVGSGTSSSDMYVFAAGVEGQYFCNQWTLSAQVGFLDSDETGYLIKEAGYVRVGAIFYPSSKFKIAGNVGYMDGVTSGTSTGDDATEWNWNLSIEYLFGRSIPVSTYLEYKGQSSEAYDYPSDQADADRHEVRAGVRFLFGADDLQKADRDGPGYQSPDLIAWPRVQF